MAVHFTLLSLVFFSSPVLLLPGQNHLSSSFSHTCLYMRHFLSYSGLYILGSGFYYASSCLCLLFPVVFVFLVVPVFLVISVFPDF